MATNPKKTAGPRRAPAGARQLTWKTYWLTPNFIAGVPAWCAPISGVPYASLKFGMRVAPPDPAVPDLSWYMPPEPLVEPFPVSYVGVPLMPADSLPEGRFIEPLYRSKLPSLLYPPTWSIEVQPDFQMWKMLLRMTVLVSGSPELPAI